MAQLSLESVLFNQSSVLTFDGAQKAAAQHQKTSFPMQTLFADKAAVRFHASENLGHVSCNGNCNFVWRYSAAGATAGFAKVSASTTPPYLLLLIKETRPDCYDIAYTDVTAAPAPHENSIADCKNDAQWTVQPSVNGQGIKTMLCKHFGI